jgi:hypothetical protein
MSKPNRAHYRIDQSFRQSSWAPSGEYLCVFHTRRISQDGYRTVALKGSRSGMSRPVEQPCSECSKRAERCEHDVQQAICPRRPGDTCGRDNGDELGGSW